MTTSTHSTQDAKGSPPERHGQREPAAPGVRLRAELAGLPSYLPGRAAGGAAARHTVYKLSSNESPFPPLPGVLAAAVAAAGSFNRYPDLGQHPTVADTRVGAGGGEVRRVFGVSVMRFNA